MTLYYQVRWGKVISTMQCNLRVLERCVSQETHPETVGKWRKQDWAEGEGGLCDSGPQTPEPAPQGALESKHLGLFTTTVSSCGLHWDESMTLGEQVPERADSWQRSPQLEVTLPSQLGGPWSSGMYAPLGQRSRLFSDVPTCLEQSTCTGQALPRAYSWLNGSKLPHRKP